MAKTSVPTGRKNRADRSGRAHTVHSLGRIFHSNRSPNHAFSLFALQKNNVLQTGQRMQSVRLGSHPTGRLSLSDRSGELAKLRKCNIKVHVFKRIGRALPSDRSVVLQSSVCLLFLPWLLALPWLLWILASNSLAMSRGLLMSIWKSPKPC